MDKFIGDAVLGVFGVPVFCNDHKERAVRASLEMAGAFEKKAGRGNMLLSSAALSVNSGLVVSGNIGSQARMEYTVIGGNVNAASRFSGLAGAGEIIIGRNVYARVRNMVTVEAQPARAIKGFSEPVETYKVLGIVAT